MKRILAKFTGIQIFYLILLLTLIFCIPVKLYLVSKQSKLQPSVNSPKPYPQTTLIQPSITPQISGDPEIKLMAVIHDRPRLSTTDTSAKNKMLALLPQGENSGTLYVSANIKIEYIQSPDLFQVEILTSEMQQAKIEGDNWFLLQGLSRQGLCDLPVMYYLNWQINHDMKKNNTTINPLPDGC